MELNLYVPTIEDYDYFKHMYTKVFINDLTPSEYNYGHFVFACLNYQIQTKKCWTEFSSINREFARDQLLFEFGLEPLGYIFSPFHYDIGIEHLTAKPTKHDY